MKPYKLAIFLISLLASLFFAYYIFLNRPLQAEVRVDFLDVGQGDSILVNLPNSFQILIDGGPDDTVIDQLFKNMPLGDKDIEWVILTHPDADHLTGLVAVLDQYNVQTVFYSPSKKDTLLYSIWQKELLAKNIQLIPVVGRKSIKISDEVTADFLYPVNKDVVAVKKTNNSSIVMRLEYQNVSFLFPGDIEAEVEEKLLQLYPQQLKSTLLKVAHHGSKSSSTPQFIKTVNPEFAVMSVGDQNRFGHPHGRILWRYQQAGAQILRTDQLGSIRFLTDGRRLCYLDRLNMGILAGFWKNEKRCIIIDN